MYMVDVKAPHLLSDANRKVWYCDVAGCGRRSAGVFRMGGVIGARETQKPHLLGGVFERCAEACSE
jgi:hypothetical protein